MLEDISGEKIKQQINSNKKLRMTLMAVGGLVILVLGYFAYRQFIWHPANDKSKDNYWVGLNYAVVDSTDMAIDELKGHVKKYDGKVGGEVAQFLYARQLMAKGEYTEALKELEGVDVSDTYVSVMTLGLQADCRSELKEYDKAAALYVEAADKSDNDMTAPMYLMKAGLCAEEVKDFKKATEYYERIRDDYAAYASQKAIDKYIARAKNKIIEKK